MTCALSTRASLAAVSLLALTCAASAQVKLGIGGPITGGAAAFGAQLKMGAEQAAEDINATGGVLGQKITTTIGDDVSDPKQGISVANKFVGDGVTWVVGHFNSSVSIPASGVYNDNALLQITPASTNPGLTDPDPKTKQSKWNVFRTCGRDDQQGGVAAAYLLKSEKGKKIAFVHDKKAYGKGLVDETTEGAQRRRGEGSPRRDDQPRREGLFRRGLQAEGGRRRDRLLRWRAYGGGPARAADARPGHVHDPHGRRRHRIGGICADRRAGFGGHADDLSARSAAEPGRRRSGQALRGKEIQSQKPTRSTPMPPCR